MISVYSSDEKMFLNNGIKILHPLKALVRKEDNGDYYIDLKDTIENIEYYQSGMIIRVNTPWGYQGFRLSNPVIENKKISCKGHHLYFDSKNYIIEDSYVVDKDCNDALDHLNTATDITSPFNTLSDIPTISSYRCVRHSLEEAIQVILERWGGHLVRDNYNIEIRQNIGEDRGVVLAYAKNITSIKADENWDNVVTKILPVGKDGLKLPEVYLSIEEILYDIPYSKVISFSQDDIKEEDFKDEDGNLKEEEYKNALIEDLRNKGLSYLQENKFPKVNYSVSAYLKNISDIGDTIYVKHPKCKIDLITNVIAIEYDCISQQYTKIEFGNFKSKLKNLISDVTANITKEVNKNNEENYAKMSKELTQATNKIWDAMGSSYVIYEGDKILVVDTLPKEEATNVIMINNGGIGFSKNGINGTFNSAWSIDGTLNMQSINVINLVADMIKGGTLKLGSNLNEAGIMEIYDEANRLICLADKTGLTIYCEDNTYVKLNPEVGFAGYDANDTKIYWADGDEFHMKKSVVEEEITLCNKLRMIPITLYGENNEVINDGIGYVALV